MFEVGDMVISIEGCGFVVETKNKYNYKSLKAEWYAICFFKQPDRVRWYEGNELQKKASDVQHR
jgi:hypothetical protein